MTHCKLGFRYENCGEIYRYTLEHADAYISRKCPGKLKDKTCYFQEMKQSFLALLAKGMQVIKYNRGSTGEGIWRVRIDDDNYEGDFQNQRLV